MKVLLVRSNELNSKFETNITGIYPPLGLAYIASSLIASGYKPTILDNHILRLRGSRLKAYLKKSDPDIVLLSSMTPSWQSIVSTSRFIKTVLPNVKIVAGGPQLTAYPKESLLEESIDFGIYGEGELSTLDVVKAIERGSELNDVKGSIYKKDGQVIINPPREEIDNLDSLPFPAIDLLPYRYYSALSVRSPFFTMVTSRGCPYKCGFCHQGYLGRYRARSVENVINEMELLVNKYGVKEIITFDETFCIDKERALKICGMINKKKLRFGWDIRTRIDLIDKDLLQALKGAGCSRLHLGIESGDQDTLDRMKKNITISDIIDKVNLAKNAGLEARGYFMLGYPGETRKNMLKTINFARSLPLDWASFTVTIGLPGTEIYRTALEAGTFKYDYWREFTLGLTPGKRPYFTSDEFTEIDLFALKREAYIKFYLRPLKMLTILRGIGRSLNVPNFSYLVRGLPAIYNSMLRSG